MTSGKFQQRFAHYVQVFDYVCTNNALSRAENRGSVKAVTESCSRTLISLKQVRQQTLVASLSFLLFSLLAQAMLSSALNQCVSWLQKTINLLL